MRPNLVLRNLLVVMTLLMSVALPEQTNAQTWVTMPNAPKNNYDWFEVRKIVALGPGVLWGVFINSSSRSYEGGFIRTLDNGQTWQREYTEGWGGSFNGRRPVDSSILDNNTAWSLSYATIGPVSPNNTAILTRTTNGPNTTSNPHFVTVCAVLPALFQRIHFFDATTGVAAALGNSGTTWQIYRSSDAGVTWTALPTALPVPAGGATIVAKTAKGSCLWLALTNGNSLQTLDGGMTWAYSDTGLGAALRGIAFRDTFNGLAFSGTSAMARTTDGGITWSPIVTTLPDGVYILTTKPGSSSTYVSSSFRQGISTISTSSDDGVTWQTRKVENFPIEDLALSADEQLWSTVGPTYSPRPSFPGADVILRYAGAPLATKATAASNALAYPNPTTGRVQLPGSEGSAVRVYDATGRVQAFSNMSGELDFSAAPAGLYFITIKKTTGVTTTQRISVVH
ncbi:T9SS type A sorting domain-containing protein [Hymenobacter armeniacus]|uniref:T9SS type A sorting domain-containing protein n=1 Tax=Hymenobacter armeniacus TaxID=2771358 RepID=A0ABR8JUS3_9BACT|nr:T9SS type A sorting domain-containing protein [Hymenobacter armeniacus]MBD2722536.1 T9SS type A sorting domain-containing protein [Hymenobacter armeniacus]